jgi:hypothetical protein
MAVELGLNRYVPNPSTNETEFQRLERRNRERTYLVLFVHDRSLSTQTGRHWMLPEDDLVRNSLTWHEGGGSGIRPEDVIVAAFVSLRRIAVCSPVSLFSSTHVHTIARLRQRMFSVRPRVRVLVFIMTSITRLSFVIAMLS